MSDTDTHRPTRERTASLARPIRHAVGSATVRGEPAVAETMSVRPLTLYHLRQRPGLASRKAGGIPSAPAMPDRGRLAGGYHQAAALEAQAVQSWEVRV
jgi:hypothetical protein